MPRDWKEDSMNSELAATLPERRHERWFDLCFRLILIALAAAWLLMPPAASEQNDRDNRTTAATR